MIYYLVFCITTTILILAKCQVPALLATQPKNLNRLVFWSVLLFFDMLFAPFFFVVLLSAPKEYKRTLIEKLGEYS